MIEVAKQRSQKYSNISFQVADILQWQFPVEKFDAITSIATLHHLAVEKLLPTFQAALKPEGKLVILDLLAQENFQDSWTDLIAIPLNWLFLFKNRKIKQFPAAKAAMREHLLTDKFLTRSQVKKIYLNSLGKAKIRKHLFWRYSVIWQKPMAS